METDLTATDLTETNLTEIGLTETNLTATDLAEIGNPIRREGHRAIARPSTKQGGSAPTSGATAPSGRSRRAV
ncbi:MAG: pentapeptide repeat-containing protein [Clostridia bacterium]|nr:pentapeptide repeat-containing protein [Clostridia bacterium]